MADAGRQERSIRLQYTTWIWVQVFGLLRIAQRVAPGLECLLVVHIEIEFETLTHQQPPFSGNQSTSEILGASVLFGFPADSPVTFFCNCSDTIIRIKLFGEVGRFVGLPIRIKAEFQ